MAAALPFSCTFDSPALTSQVGGAQPSFGFYANNTNYFGIPASFTKSGTYCYTDNEPLGATSFQPVIVSSTFTQTCQFAGGVNSLYCPELHDSAFPTGTHTLTYAAVSGFVPFIPTTFVVANGVRAPTQYITVVSKTTAPTPAAQTSTILIPQTSSTTTQNIAVTQTSTVQQITTITSCATSTPTTTTTPVPTSSLTCPGINGQLYKGFIIECYTDRYDSDLTNTPSSSINDCINQCINTPGCVDVSWVPGSPGVCYMKNNIGTAQTNSGVWGARNAFAASTTIPSAAPTVLSCPQSNGPLVWQNSGKVFKVECGIDRQDNDMLGNPVIISNLNQCVNACDAKPGCQDVSLSGVACYLKSAPGTLQNNAGILGARLISYPSGGLAVYVSASVGIGMKAERAAATPTGPVAMVAGAPAIMPVAPGFVPGCTHCSGWAGPDTTYGPLPAVTITTTQSTTITPAAQSVTTTVTQGTALFSASVTYTILTITYTNKATTTAVIPVQSGLGALWGGLGGQGSTSTVYFVTTTLLSTSTVP